MYSHVILRLSAWNNFISTSDTMYFSTIDLLAEIMFFPGSLLLEKTFEHSIL